MWQGLNSDPFFLCCWGGGRERVHWGHCSVILTKIWSYRFIFIHYLWLLVLGTAVSNWFLTISQSCRSYRGVGGGGGGEGGGNSNSQSLQMHAMKLICSFWISQHSSLMMHVMLWVCSSCIFTCSLALVHALVRVCSVRISAPKCLSMGNKALVSLRVTPVLPFYVTVCRMWKLTM